MFTKIFKKSLRNKFLTLFISMGVVPFITLLIYTLYLSETKILNKLIIEQLQRTQTIEKTIKNHIFSLQKEVEFLSSLDLMDDIVVEDIDKRISRLLKKKYEDLSLDLTFFVLSKESVIIASSQKELLQTKYKLKNLTKRRGNYIYLNQLYIYTKIYATFNPKKFLGYLVMRYNLHNLTHYLPQEKDMHTFLINPLQKITIGTPLQTPIKIDKEKNSIIDKNHLIVYKKLNAPLQKYYLIYSVDKSIALEFLYDFIRFMLYMSALIFILIIYLSIKYSREIVKPIEELTDITNEIISTKNYTKRLDISSQEEDEIATLSTSFNKMLETTSIALHNLEKENKLRLQRFTQLIEIFNTIIQTKDEGECLKQSLKELKKLTKQNNIVFIKEKNIKSNYKYIEIYVTDFQNAKPLYYGSIKLGIESFKDSYEDDFYNSIATMIQLQLDRVRLIQTTLIASNAKSAFISNMSHELRTPLHAIMGSVQSMIMYETLTEKQLDSMGNIESSAEYLLNMINDILDIAKIESGTMKVEKKEVDVLQLTTTSFDMLAPLAYDKGLTINLINKSKKHNYTTDPKLLQQIIINLLSNAIKFTKEGSVDIELYNQDKKLYIKIKDSGIGIEREDLTSLFEEFTQVENVMQKQHKGTGLGLALSRKMAHLIDAEVSLHSEGLSFGTVSLLWIK